MKYLIPLFSLLLVTARCVEAADPPAHIEIAKLPNQSTLVDDVVVPLPSEIFGVLDKLGSPNWHDVLRNAKVAPSGPRPQIALLLGAVIAEGFIAVEAQDSEQVKKIGRDVLTLAGAIGVKKSVIARSNAIIEAADKQDWNAARKELDLALKDVKQAMTELHDDQLAQLVSLGGWLRGTEALCEVVQKNYSRDAADLLHQPVLLDHFESRLKEMPPRLKKASVLQIESKLGDIRSQITGPVITPKNVDAVHDIVRELVKSISSN